MSKVFFWIKKWYFYVIVLTSFFVSAYTSDMSTGSEYAGGLIGLFIFYAMIFTFIGVIIFLISKGDRNKQKSVWG